MDYQDAIKYYDRKFNRAKEIRKSYEPVWDEIMHREAPDLLGYLNIDKRDNHGDRDDQQIYDNTPVKAWLDCSAALYANIASPSRPWILRTMANPDYDQIPGIRSWLDDITFRDYSTLHNSGFYRANWMMFAQGSAIGTAVMVAQPDYYKTIRWTVPNVGEYWLMVDGHGEVDTFFREITYTAEQLKELFGENALPDDIRASITKDRPTGSDCVVRHVIEPDTQGLAPFRKPWASVYYLCNKSGDPKQVLDIKGYNIKPFAAWRWGANSNEVYGKYNPGREGLGNAITLADMVWDFMDAVQREIIPPTQGPAVSAGLDVRPGHHNIVDQAMGDPTIKRLVDTRPNLQAQWQAVQDMREKIKSDWYLDLFMPITTLSDTKGMSATEVNLRNNERMLALGPVLENVNGEYLNPVTEIQYYYSSQAGIYPLIDQYVAPDDLQALQGQQIKTDYVSILAQAQKAVDLGRVQMALQYAQMFAQFDPSVAYKINAIDGFDEVAKMGGAPGKMINSDKYVQQMKQQAAEQAQNQQMAEQAPTLAKAAQAAGNIDMSKDTAFTRMLGVN